MFRSIAFALMATLSLAAAAEPDQVAIEDTIAAINPDAKINSIKPSPIAGLNEVIADGIVIYVSDDGRYIVHGVMLDVPSRKNLTELASAGIHKEMLDAIPDADKIIYKPKGKPKYVVRVFTDISCGYCQLLHKSMQEYLDAGVQIEYMAYPRGGPESPALGQMEQVWCSADRNAAYAKAIGGGTVEASACSAPVRKQFELGTKLGLQGTPAMFALDGEQLGGYVPVEDLVKKLDSKARRERRATADKSTAKSASAGTP